MKKSFKAVQYMQFMKLTLYTPKGEEELWEGGKLRAKMAE